MPILVRGLEPDLLGNVLCLLIQTMPQSVNYAQYLYLASCQKSHLQSYLALDPELSGFRSVLRMRLRDHDRRDEGRFRWLDGYLGGRIADVGGKAGRCHRTGDRLAGAANDAIGEAGRSHFAHVVAAGDAIRHSRAKRSACNRALAGGAGAAIRPGRAVERSDCDHLELDGVRVRFSPRAGHQSRRLSPPAATWLLATSVGFGLVNRPTLGCGGGATAFGGAGGSLG